MDPAIEAEIKGLSYQRSMNEAMAGGDSEIQRFYNNLTIFVTGGSGFIGKQLIEKLLRSCEIKKVFVLIRTKKGKTTQERLAEMLSDPVFEAVRSKKPHFEQRIVAVEGDVAEIGLAISEENRKMLIEEVDIIFHAAATIRFDEAIRLATLTNVRGTREAIKLGKACMKLKSFVYVSTAYCHTTTCRAGSEIMEQFYECPAPPDSMIEFAEANTDELDIFTASLIKNWPNTYTFSKAIAEEVVRTESGGMPVAVVRPSIVVCSYIEPSPGWLDISCMYGPTGIVIGVGLGVIRVLYLNNKMKLSFVPVDYVNNATIAAGWNAAVTPNNDITIYNISTTNCGVTFKSISNPMRTKCRTLASPLALWYLFMIETNSRILYWFLSGILHYIPAYFIDGIITLFRLKKPKELKGSFVQVYKKYDKLGEIFKFFLTNEWNFNEMNLTNLSKRMSKADRLIYNFEMSNIDWDWYTLMWCLGARKYVVKDGLKNTRAAVKKQKWLKLANYGVCFLYLLIACYIVKFIYSSFFHL